MDQLVRITIVFILLVPSLFGFFTVMNILFPKRIAKTQNILQQATSRSFWIGFVNVLFLLPISLFLLSLGDSAVGPMKTVVMFPALFLLAVLFGLASFGLLNTVNMTGEKLMPDQSLMKRTFWGTLLLSLACALPFVGWFLLLPYVLMIGVGSVILSFFQKGEVSS
ncbi:MAG TPA: hypothetical protein VLT51_03575 [Anaerolineales bacterium]|nr:hypothetical protein [Anaerolineales bacterium]